MSRSLTAWGKIIHPKFGEKANYFSALSQGKGEVQAMKVRTIPRRVLRLSSMNYLLPVQPVE